MNRALSLPHTLIFLIVAFQRRGKINKLRTLHLKRRGVTGSGCHSLTLGCIVVGDVAPCPPVVIFSFLCVSEEFTSEDLWGVLCRVCLCRVPFLSNVLFVPKRRQPGVRENLCSMNHSEVLPSVAPPSPAQRFAGEWTQITALSTSLLPSLASFFAFVFPLCFDQWCSLAAVHSCTPMQSTSIPFPEISRWLQTVLATIQDINMHLKMDGSCFSCGNSLTVARIEYQTVPVDSGVEVPLCLLHIHALICTF